MPELESTQPILEDPVAHGNKRTGRVSLSACFGCEPVEHPRGPVPKLDRGRSDTADRNTVLDHGPVLHVHIESQRLTDERLSGYPGRQIGTAELSHQVGSALRRLAQCRRIAPVPRTK